MSQHLWKLRVQVTVRHSTGVVLNINNSRRHTVLRDMPNLKVLTIPRTQP